MLYSMKWHQKLSAGLLSSALLLSPLVTQMAQADVIQLQDQDKVQLAQLDRRQGETLQDLKREPSRAFLLSTLYPGLGQLYIGNDNPRAYMIMGAGTLILAGSIVGYGLLADRPPEASSMGNLLITLTLLGYHLWNIRDAYVQADEYNKMLDKESLFSLLDHVQLSYRDETLTLSWHMPL